LTPCGLLRPKPLTGGFDDVSTVVVYLFGGERSRAKNMKVMRELMEHKGHNEFILVQASRE
jgi:hypothetical protein